MILNLEIPDDIGLTEEDVKNWVLILVERKEKKKQEVPQEIKVLSAQRIEEYKIKNKLVSQETTQPLITQSYQRLS